LGFARGVSIGEEGEDDDEEEEEEDNGKAYGFDERSWPSEEKSSRGLEEAPLTTGFSDAFEESRAVVSMLNN